MKKQILVMVSLAAVIFSISSCKKDSSVKKDPMKTDTTAPDTAKTTDTTKATTYYIKFNADTTTYNFTTAIQGNFNKKDASGHYDFSLSGQANALKPASDRMIITGVNADSLVINKYYQNYGSATDTTSKALIAQLNWYNSKSESFLSWGKEFSSAIIADTRIKFIAITQYTMKGTFSGTVYIAIDASSEKHKITSGEFYVQRVP